MNPRFKHTSPEKPQAAAVAKEAIGEFLFRRSREFLSPEMHLAGLGISRGDIADIVEIINETAAENEEKWLVVLDAAADIDTIGQLIEQIDLGLIDAPQAGRAAS
jgi:hypothetical protein